VNDSEFHVYWSFTLLTKQTNQHVTNSIHSELNIGCPYQM